jgi:hypothetical protein
MTYDAATHTVVLFGGGDASSHSVRGTWTWNGSNWAQQAPITSPPGLIGASMTYDAAAAGTVILFGGQSFPGGGIGGTWTWNGATWAQQKPATHPSARMSPSMAYDSATRTAVMFGGGATVFLNDTWTWNGTAWAQQTPATSPPARDRASMAYDAATGTVVLFGGVGVNGALNDTWTWNGSDWTQQTPAR